MAARGEGTLTTAGDGVAIVVERASTLIDLKRADDARSVALAAIGTDPDDARLWAVLARAEAARRDDRACRDAAERALGLRPDDSGALATLVNAHLRLGAVAPARQAADRLLELQPEWAHAHLLWAFTRTRWSRARRTATDDHFWPVADQPRAEAALDRALELDPHDGRLFADAARCYDALAHARPTVTPKVAAAIARALELEPNDERVLLAAGTVGRPSRRVHSALRVLEQHPTSDEALRRVNHAVWSRMTTGVALMVGYLGLSVLGADDAAVDGAQGTASQVIGWIVTGVVALWFLAVETSALATFPRRLLRNALRKDPQMRVVIAVTVVTWLLGTGVAVVLLGGIVPYDSDGYPVAMALLAGALLLQVTAWGTSEVSRARSEVRDGLWTDSALTRTKLRRGTASQVFGTLVGFCALLTWALTGFAAPHPGSAGAAVLPASLAAWACTAGIASETVKYTMRTRPTRLVVHAVLGVGFLLLAVLAFGLQVAEAVGAA